MTTEQTQAQVIEPSGLVISSMSPGTPIQANFEVLEEWIHGKIADYQGAVIAPSYVKQAKKDRAFLNGLAKTLDAERLRVKREYMQPVNAFEEQVKKLLAPIKEASAAIDQQVKAIEEQQREERRAELVKHWQAYVLSDAVPFEVIEDAKWLNLSSNLMAAFAEIDAIAAKIVADEEALTALGLAHEIEAKATYYATLDMGKAIARNTEIERQIEAAKAIEAHKAAFVEPAPPAPTADEVAADMLDQAPPPEKRHVYHIEVTCTRSELDQVIDHMKQLGLKGRALR